ncbi:N-glycosylase/DNA lyase [Candidatus Woesearchaeota archaeon]|nr:N-glycosylase/DNA lyase [Candidatus Woesearchaeota archaeon]
MKKLVNTIINLKKSEVSKRINNRLKEFSSFKNKPTDAWFSELCFCLLTANSKAKTALNIQNELGAEGFYGLSQKEIKNCIRRNKHRFHNNKSEFIVGARVHFDIKNKITKLIKQKSQLDAREWLVQNIKGLGYKESSHYLRNTGHFNLAILDRHVLNLMVENKLLQEKPKSLNRARYLDIEQKLEKVADKLQMSQAELDMYLWYMKTGEVLK